MTAYIPAIFAGTAFICSIVYLIRMGYRAIIELSRQNDVMNADQRNGYTINRSAPTWLEGDK